MGFAPSIAAFAMFVAGAFACRSKFVALADTISALFTLTVHRCLVYRSPHVCNGFVWKLAPGKFVNDKARHPIATRCRAAVCGDKSVCCAHVSQLSHREPPCIGWRIPDDVLHTSTDVAMARVVTVWSAVVLWVSSVPAAMVAFSVTQSRKLAIVCMYSAVMIAIHIGLNMVITVVLYAMLGGVAWKLMRRTKGVRRAILGVFVAGTLCFAAAPMFGTLKMRTCLTMLGRTDSAPLSPSARAYNASLRCGDAHDGSVVGLVDSGSTNHITTREEYLINVHSREHSRLDGMGSTLTTAIGDSMAVFARNDDFTEFTEPKMLTNTLCAPHQDHTLLSESALEADGVYRDTVNRRMFFSDAIDGEQTNTVPLGPSVSGKNRKLYPVNMVFLMADGRPHDSDCTEIANAYRAFLDRQTISPSAAPTDPSGGRSQAPDDKRAYVASRANEPFTFVDAFGGYGSITRVLGLAGHVPVAYFDASATAVDEYDKICPFVPSSSDLDTAMRDPDFVLAARSADVAFATPPCRSYSSAGKQQGDSTADGELLVRHLDDMLREVSPRVHVIETSPTVPEFDNGRIMDRLVNVALKHDYRPQWFHMNAQDYGGCQHRNRCFVVCVRHDVHAAIGPMYAPTVTTPTRSATVRDCLDPVDRVDWNSLRSTAPYQPRMKPHDVNYTAPRRDFHTGDGLIGDGSFSIDGPACAFKVYDAPNAGGWSQVYYDDRDPGNVGHRRLSVDEARRVMGLPPASTDERTQRMCGGGVDAHVVRALGSTIAEYITAFRDTLEPPQALLHKQDVQSSPAEVSHGRWGCPGIVAAKKLGWSQCENFFCSHCPHGKVTRASIRRARVPRVERVGALVCGDIIGPFPPSKTAGYR